MRCRKEKERRKGGCEGLRKRKGGRKGYMGSSVITPSKEVWER